MMEYVETFLRRHSRPRCWLTPTAIAFALVQAWIAISVLVDEKPPINVPTVGVVLWLAALVAIAQPWWSRPRVVSSFLIAALLLLSVGALFGADAWNQDFGGFPAIGDGALVLKHVTLGAMAAWIGLTGMRMHSAAQVVLAIARMGVVAVLLVIGGAKFVSYEAEAIDGLLVESPILGWMRKVWDVQGVSTIIGVMEILIGLAMLGWPYRRRSGLIGLAMCAGLLLTTTTFLFSLPAWSAGAGAPWLDADGIFLVEDQLLLLACVMSIFLETPPRIGQSY